MSIPPGNLGIDYASVDGNSPPDLAKAKTNGLGYAIIRANYSTWPDPTCKRDRDNIRAAGLTYGAYFFPVVAPNAPSPEEQVSVYVANAGLIKGRDLPPILDVEYAHGIAATGRTRDQNAKWLRQAIAALAKAYGLPISSIIKYCSARVLDTNDTDTLAGAADKVLAGLLNWLARYVIASSQPAVLNPTLSAPPIPNCDGGKNEPDAWWFRQYQGDAVKFAGFDHMVDCDVYNPLFIGAHGARVSWVQRLINAVVDDRFGPETMAKLVDFQVSNGLTPFGFVDVKTLCALAWSAPC